MSAVKKSYDQSGCKTFGVKDRLLIDSNSLWVIQQGTVRAATWNEDAVGVTLGFWGVGDVIGHPLSQVQPYYLECLTPVVIRKVHDMGELVEALVKQSCHNEAFINILHQPFVRSRLLGLLMWLAERFGTPQAKGYLLDLALTHQEIADTISATRVTVTRLINRLEQEGKIQRAGRLLHINILA